MKKAIFWFRRDLRLHDNSALYHALHENEVVLPIFIFDTNILGQLKNTQDPRLDFIIQSLQEIELKLQKKYGSSISILHGDPTLVLPAFAKKNGISSIYVNRDYEPYAKQRDHRIAELLQLKSYQDQVIFESADVLKNDGEIYHVFTPYKNKWLEKFDSLHLKNNTPNFSHLAKINTNQSILEDRWYKSIGFGKSGLNHHAGSDWALSRLNQFERKILANYHQTRDIPAVDGTSGLSTHLRHGNLSIRDMVKVAIKHDHLGAQTWLSELIWREFFQVLLDRYPRLSNESFQRKYDQIKWTGKPEHYDAWINGETGFPLIDAAMRCFKQTGTMHNRLRMLTASFLCKTLLLDWRLGEEYFASQLIDFDLAANIGGWQWSASVGCDAQPYFRIFNPFNQSNKFDPHGEFIRKWCPEYRLKSDHELHDESNPNTIVNYKANRLLALNLYKSCL